MAEISKKLDLPGEEVETHHHLHAEEDGQLVWGITDPSSKFHGVTPVDGARKFLFGSDQKRQFIEMGGIVVDPPDLILDTPQSWMAYGVVYPEAPTAE